jgi:hypothetical protein
MTCALSRKAACPMRTHLAAMPRRPPAWLAVAAALGGSLLSLLACGDSAPVGPTGSPVIVQSVALTPDTATVAIGQTVALAASIAADGALAVENITWSVARPGWSAARVASLSVVLDSSRRSAKFTAPDAGSYLITVRAGDRTASATVTVLAFPVDSPLLGRWQLSGLRLRPDSGGDPEPVPFVSGFMTVDAVGHISIYIVYPDPDPYGDDSNPRDFPYVRSDGPRLLLCQDQGDFCQTATVRLDGTRLSMVGPTGSFDFGGGRFESGTPEWEFER